MCVCVYALLLLLLWDEGPSDVLKKSRIRATGRGEGCFSARRKLGYWTSNRAGGKRLVAGKRSGEKERRLRGGDLARDARIPLYIILLLCTSMWRSRPTEKRNNISTRERRDGPHVRRDIGAYYI